MNPVLTPDIAIAGAGIIGVSVALELRSRGASVVLLDTATAVGGASIAAAGMLAPEDPHNPTELSEFSAWSLSLYDGFLNRLGAMSGSVVPFQTTATVQYLDDTSTIRIRERSIDPRQLAGAALAAVQRAAIPILEHCGKIEIVEQKSGVRLTPAHGGEVVAKTVIHASGAWFSGPLGGTPAIRPRKGQMLRVQIPASLNLTEVHRSSSIYIVPRTQGPQAGGALIGATDEDAGFDLGTSQADLDLLRSRAAALLPGFGSPVEAPQVEAWAGLRPASRDGLPLIGRLLGSTHQWLATGHYRNGILLAPGTAVALADLVENKPPAIDLRAFDPARL
ncbi:MAG TPA: FAD-dependent oxidoreductase, partial [Acidobacteriaceae bacterium]